MPVEFPSRANRPRDDDERETADQLTFHAEKERKEETRLSGTEAKDNEGRPTGRADQLAKKKCKQLCHFREECRGEKT